MTQPSQPQPGGTTLWDTGRIRAYVDQHYKDYGTRWSAMYHGTRMMADEYENAIAERDTRIKALEQELAEAKGDAEHWHMRYLNGVDCD